jgi:signal transduction histidine kinase
MDPFQQLYGSEIVHERAFCASFPHFWIHDVETCIHGRPTARAEQRPKRAAKIVSEDDDTDGCRRYVGPVDAAALARRYALDVLVVVLAVWGVADAAAHPVTYDGYDKGPDWFVWIAPAMMALPLLGRHRWPFMAPAATFFFAAAGSFVSGEAVVDGAPQFLTVMLAAFLLGSTEPLLAGVGFSLMVGTVALVDANMREFEWGDFFFPVLIFGTAMAAGHLNHRREQGVAAALERARELEAELDDAARRAVDEERQRISRELHDVIAHSVSVMTVQAGAVRRLLLPEQERERAALEAVEETGRQALTEMRRLVGMLRESDPEQAAELAPQPGLRTLELLLGAVREAGLPVDLQVEGEARELAPGVDLSAYRIVQEALTNALKHAGPAHAWVTLRWSTHELELEIANDGETSPNGQGAGHGLAGLHERVAIYGGEFISGPRPGGGYLVRARLPTGVDA